MIEANETAIVDVQPVAIFKEEHTLLKEIFRDEYRLRFTKPLKSAERLDESAVFLEGGLVEIASIPTKTSPKLLSRSGVLSALSKITSSDEFRPAMTGVFFDEEANVAIATDGFKLVSIPYNASTADRGKIIHPKTGVAIDETYPNWRSVLPTFDCVVEGVDVETMLNRLKGIQQANKYFVSTRNTPPTIKVKLVVGTESALFSPDHLFDMLTALASTGTGTVDILWKRQGEYRTYPAVTFRDTTFAERSGLIMPIRAKGDECYSLLVDPSEMQIVDRCPQE